MLSRDCHPYGACNGRVDAVCMFACTCTWDDIQIILFMCGYDINLFPGLARLLSSSSHHHYLFLIIFRVYLLVFLFIRPFLSLYHIDFALAS